MFLEAGIAPRSVMELDNVDSAKKMVELGLGVAFLPHVAVADEMRSGTPAHRRARRPPPAAPPDRRGAAEGCGRRRSARRLRSSTLLRELGPELQAAASATA